jgi:quercetin 2,3-dioxygenase
MAIQIISRDRQAKGQFNYGAILENKPVSAEGGPTRPFSNLFYWAHAWSSEGSTIGEHPHKAFEIISFVIRGEIQHYDSKYREWKTLKAGDAQIIRAGSGISHSERLSAGAHMFQVWFDPNLSTALSRPASYDDYPSSLFPLHQRDGYTVKVYREQQGPMEMESEGVEIREYRMDSGQHTLELSAGKICAAYLIEGSAIAGAQVIEADDFLIAEHEKELKIVTEASATLFMIQVSERPSYSTYAEQHL